MAIVFPLASPLEDATMRRPTSIRLRPRKLVARSIAPFSLVPQTYEHPGERWEGELTLPPMDRRQGMRWASWLTSLRGPVGSFLVGDPLAMRPMGAAAHLPGNPQVNDSHVAGERVLRVKTGLPSVANWLLAGSYVSLGSGLTRRLHLVTRDASLNDSGVTILEIWPALRTTAATNDAVAIENATGKFMLTSQVDYGADANGHYRAATVAFEEDLRA